MKEKILKSATIIISVVAVVASGFYLKSTGKLFAPSQKITEGIMSFVNSAMLGGEIQAELVDAKSESGLYKLTLNIEGQSYDTYATKDGKYFFAQAYNVADFLAAEEEKNKEIPKTVSPDVKLFVMSYCPYGNQAEDAIAPAIKTLGDGVSFEMHYIVDSMEGDGTGYCLNDGNEYCSLHGIKELNQDVRELCVQKYDKAKLLDFVTKINSDTDLDNVDVKWKGIASALGIDTAKIENCAKNEAESLLASELELSNQFEASGSPTLVINGVRYTKDRTSEAYKNAICEAMENPAESCSVELDSSTSAVQGDCGE